MTADREILESSQKVLGWIFWIRFNHRLEERPFLGVGPNADTAEEDASRLARLHWGLGDSKMGLTKLASWHVPLLTWDEKK